MSVTNHTILQTRVLFEKLTAIHVVKELIFLVETEAAWQY